MKWGKEDVENFVKTYREEYEIEVGDVTLITEKEYSAIKNGYWIWDDWVELFAYDSRNDSALEVELQRKHLIHILEKYEPRKNNNQYVYIIYDKQSKITKIGKANDVKARLKTLQTGNVNLELYGFLQCKNGFAIESILHRYFKNKKIKSEWFDITPEEAYSKLCEVSKENGCSNAVPKRIAG